MDPGGTLLAMDFDDTMTDGDTSEAAVDLLGRDVPRDVQCIRPYVAHTPFMDVVFVHLKSRGVTPDEILAAVRKIPLAPGIGDLLSHVRNAGLDLIVISDGNSAFIDAVLEAAGVGGIVPKDKIYTNPAWVDDVAGRVRVQPYDEQRECDMCPANLCKGDVLAKHVEKRRKNGFKTERIIFAGDDVNDFCACRKLGPRDFIFCRKSHPLEKFLLDEMAKPADENRVRAQVRFFDHADSIRELLTGVDENANNSLFLAGTEEGKSPLLADQSSAAPLTNPTTPLCDSAENSEGCENTPK